MADKVRETYQFNHLKAKYIGLGDSETTREEFITNTNRDTYSSLAQHDGLLLYNSLALNEPTELIRIKMLKKMIQPIKNTS